MVGLNIGVRCRFDLILGEIPPINYWGQPNYPSPCTRNDFFLFFFSFHCLEGKSALNFHPSTIAYVGAIVKGCTNTILTGTRPVKCIIAVVFNDFTSTRLLFLPISPSPFYNLPGNLMSYDHKHERHLYRFKQQAVFVHIFSTSIAIQLKWYLVKYNIVKHDTYYLMFNFK